MTRYQELASALRSRIAHREFAVGSTLPSEQQLAAEYRVSRGTVRNALGVLEVRGMIEAARGNGWLVSSQLQMREFGQMRTFPEWAESQGLAPGGLVVDSKRDTPTRAELRVLRAGPGESVLRVTRVRMLDGNPVMLERTVYAPWMVSLIESLPTDEPSIARVLRAQGIHPARGVHRVDAVAASSEDAQYLSVPRSSPILRVRREYVDSTGRPIEVGEDRYLGGAVTFAIDVAAPG